jgi:predicted regulator of Ras-like GTPase activity (Roadblock/LC7/MglB family)/Tfp pilus assembly protein PilF
MIGADDIKLMSDALAADPGSLVFLTLGEALRRQGQLDMAWRVATRGLERHPRRADAHDLVARIAVDRGDGARARQEWEATLAIVPGHPAAQKGLGFILFQQGELDQAERLLTAAAAADPQDPSLVLALDRVRSAARDPMNRATQAIEAPRPTPVEGTPVLQARPSRTTQAIVAPVPFAPTAPDPRELFTETLADPSMAALLLDADGLVLAGKYRATDGRDAAADVGAQLAGVSDEAARAMRHLGLGAWRQIVFEAETASVAMAPTGGGLLLVAAPRRVLPGLVRRILDRTLERARKWLESGT